ncbi:hypothetical protein JAAARDRAFT_46478 [Jaapia argillacea MUCL 33604]|uniref:C2 domain-containing protein n=1 Tax=Jaapia argillacea MUCL 33604 TaxID=933084 RepID=A0A067Q191_9AGAM|nr:hypothetical protein JAAARDRAFT_46478 [Jaapia argillacea MUCL 33604]
MAAHLIEKIHDAASKVTAGMRDTKSMAKGFAEEMKLGIPYVDLTIQFIGASGLPRMDVGGLADPYFVAKLDDKISMVQVDVSTTLKPVWNELWRVKNVPTHAVLRAEVCDKDEGRPVDDYIGRFQTTVSAGAKEAEIEGPLFKQSRGTFWLKVSQPFLPSSLVELMGDKIESAPSGENPEAHPYLFDGPIRFSRHYSPTVGRLTNINDDRLYSTWKMYIKGIPLFFGDRVQHWNRKYKAAQSIFEGPASLAVRSGIQAGHRLLYARSPKNGFGVINDPKTSS